MSESSVERPIAHPGAPRARAFEPNHSTGIEARLARLDRYARWLDASVGIPGTRWRVGADSLIGLVPVIGDAAGVLLSTPIIATAWQLGLSRARVLRMAANVGFEAVLGSVPVLGDVFDAWFKANQINMRLLREALDRETTATE